MTAITILAAATLAACTHHVSVTPFALPKPLVEPLPIAVGVYYSPEFRAGEKTDTPIYASSGAGSTYVVTMGPASVAMFDQLFGAVFAHIVTVDKTSLGPTDTQLAAVIEPRLLAVHVTDFGERVSLVYMIAVHAPAGEVLAEMRVQGVDQGVEAAMRDAAAEFLLGFCESKEIKGWLGGIDSLSGGCEL
jgi:hypothetical protein